MPRKRQRSRAAPPKGPRTPPLTREEQRAFRTAVIETLGREPGKTVHATVREFARQLVEAHGATRPFEERHTVEARLRMLERNGVIHYQKGRSRNYMVATAITLVNAAATEPPRRTLTRHGRASPAEQQRRRVELLAVLEATDGGIESIRSLTEHVAQEYGDRHRHGTVTVDMKALEEKRLVEKQNGRVHGRPSQRIVITSTGRQALAKYRDRHSGDPKPPGSTGLGAAPPVAAPANQRPKLSDLSRSVLGEFARRHSSGEATPVSEIIRELLPSQGFAASLDRKEFAQKVRFRCRDLSSSGYLKRRGRGTYEITEAGLHTIGAKPSAAPPPAAQPTAATPASPATPATTSSTPLHGAAAPTTTPPNGVASETIRAIDADIGRTREEAERLQAERARIEAERGSIEQRLRDIDTRTTALDGQAARLARLRDAAAEAYAEPPPTGTAPEKQ